MRSNHWEYLALILFALGLALTISGSLIFVYFQQNLSRKTQYNGIQVPLIVTGACLIALGSFAFYKFKVKKTDEGLAGETLPPPPPPPPPPLS